MDSIFERNKHVYHSEAFDELIKDIIRFFNGTPVHSLPPPEKFHGTGVYAIYYTGKSDFYNLIYEANRLEFHQPIYVGKAVPRGWRQAKDIKEGVLAHELFGRLKEHSKSIIQSENLNLEDFHCRFIILENNTSHLIGTVEAALIRYYTPIWNTKIDGFGNHDPGSGRYNQAKSEWDVLHPGRSWANKCLGQSSALERINEKILAYFNEKKNRK
jgi:hypothetical protein